MAKVSIILIVVLMVIGNCWGHRHHHGRHRHHRRGNSSEEVSVSPTIASDVTSPTPDLSSASPLMKNDKMVILKNIALNRKRRSPQQMPPFDPSQAHNMNRTEQEPHHGHNLNGSTQFQRQKRSENMHAEQHNITAEHHLGHNETAEHHFGHNETAEHHFGHHETADHHGRKRRSPLDLDITELVDAVKNAVTNITDQIPLTIAA
ncbi:hypothetical protein CHUAL_004615 [Chamberlinius hualienensis]